MGFFCKIVFLLLPVVSLSYVLVINQTNQILNLAELGLFFNGGQLDPSTLSVSISSAYQDKALDLFTKTEDCFDYRSSTFCSSAVDDKHPWIMVDTGSAMFNQILVLNRVDGARNRILHADIAVFDRPLGKKLWSSTFTEPRFKYQFEFEAIDPALCPEDASTDCWTHKPMALTHALHSQGGQDDWAVHFFRGKRDGVFVEVGANDGITFSNAYTLEKEFGWRGLVIEPLQKHYASLIKHRQSPVLNFCVYNRTFISRFIEVSATDAWQEKFGFGQDMLSGVEDSWKWHSEEPLFDHHRVESVVPCFHMQEVLDSFNISHIDYLTLDAEGAELLIAQAIDWTRTTVTVVNIDIGRNSDHIKRIVSYFRSLGYVNFEQIDSDMSFYK